MVKVPQSAAIRLGLFGLSLSGLPAAAQEFAFEQSCALTLEACDIGRDGSEACATGKTVQAEFRAEGEAFYLTLTGAEATGFALAGPGAAPGQASERRYDLGQGYVSDKLRVFYIKGDARLDGVFWISVPDGAAGAQLAWDGLEDYFGGACTAL